MSTPPPSQPNGTRPAPAQRAPGTPIRAAYIWLDGELVPFARAAVHFLTPTLHYGPGVFEGIRCYRTDRGPAVFRLREHLNRFLASIRILGFDDLSHNIEELREAVHRTIHANGFDNCYVRPMMYLEGGMGLNMDGMRPVVGVAAWPWGPYLGEEARERGVRMMVSSFTRMHPNASMTKAKINGQYVNSMLAKTLAVRAGFDEAIMLDPEGYVAECTGENLFVVRDNVLYTTPGAPILEGITRDTIFTLAGDAGYRVVEARLSRDQLYAADEVFACGTAAEVVAVREIDNRRIGNGRMGPITRDLQTRYLNAVHGRSQRHQDWLDHVVAHPLY